MSIANIAMMLKKKKKSSMKPFLKAHWADMKQHTQYNDPVRNSSFNRVIVITSIHFTILPRAVYLD